MKKNVASDVSLGRIRSATLSGSPKVGQTFSLSVNRYTRVAEVSYLCRALKARLRSYPLLIIILKDIFLKTPVGQI